MIKTELNIADIKDKLQEILNSVHNKLSKKNIVKHNNRLSFACPFCLDSVRDSNKKRGNLYLNSLFYKCYNCDTYCSLLSLFDSFDVSVSLEERTLISELIKEKTFFVKNNSGDIENIKEFLVITKDEFVNKLGLTNVAYHNVAKDYMQFRKIPKKWWNNIYYNRGHYYILNILVSDDIEYIIGYTERTLNANIRYLQRVYKDVLNLFENTELLNHEYFEQFNHFSGYFNLYNVDFDRPLFLTEGGFDAMFLRNAIALNGVNKHTPFECDNYFFIFDNDDIGLKKMRKLLKKGNRVFMWKKFIDDFGLENHNIKDVNDLFCVLLAKKVDVKELKFKNYFTNNVLQGLYV